MNAVLPFPEPRTPDPKRVEPSPSPSAWTHRAQLAMAFLLGVAVTILALTLIRFVATPGPTQIQQNAAQPPLTSIPTASGPSATPVPSPPVKGKPLPSESSIDVNRATLAELMTLPGIGPGLAQRIIDHRSREPFRTLSDLDRVSGIGPKTLDKLRPYVTVGIPTNPER